MTRSRGTALAVTGLLLVAGAGAGCAAGQEAETSVMYSSTNGVVADIGPIAMRDMYVYSGHDGGLAPGDTGYIRVTVYNGGDKADELLGARTDKGDITIGTGGASLSPSSSPLQASPTNPPAPATGTATVTLPSTTIVRFDDPTSGRSGAYMKFTNTSGKTLHNGVSIAITFTYRDAGSVAALVPIEDPHDTTETATPVPSPKETPPTLIVPPGGSPTPSPSRTPATVPLSASPSSKVTVVPPPIGTATPTP